MRPSVSENLQILESGSRDCRISRESHDSGFPIRLSTVGQTPAFTTIAVLTLALAIGVNSGVFALINGVVLRPMVRVRPAEVVNVSTKQNAKHDYRQFSHAEYQALRAGKDVFADVAAVNFALAGIGRDEGMRRSFAFLTSENFFSLMGVEPALGRFYNADECRPNANIPVVVVSHAFWKRIGRCLTPATIFLAVIFGPDTNLRGVDSPLRRTFTWVPPTSIASIFMRTLPSTEKNGSVRKPPYKNSRV